MKTITIKITNIEKEHLLNNQGCFEDSCSYATSVFRRIIKQLKEEKKHG